MHRATAIACLTAGVFVLAGAGWALLVLGALVWVAGPRDVKWLEARTHVQARLRTAAVYLRTMPRRAVAAGSMGAGVAGVPAGVLLWFGIGPAVVAIGALLLGVSVLTGWNS